MMPYDSSRRAAEELRKEIEELLGSIGFLCRVFSRGKNKESLEKKVNSVPGKYSVSGRLIQDIVGIRVILYFPEDIPIVQEILCGRYSHIASASTIDAPSANEFSVTRHNLIFVLPVPHDRDIRAVAHEVPIDCTFEVQIRSILSEGWHEVEHDLRYKRPAHWDGHDDLSRSLNGLVATLETAEWSMRKILDDLAYRHYKNKNWAAMLHCALRMRATPHLSSEICAALDSDLNLAKEIFRISRHAVFRSLVKLAPKIPVTLDNIVYLWNFVSVGNQSITNLTPQFLRDTFEASLMQPVQH